MFLRIRFILSLLIVVYTNKGFSQSDTSSIQITENLEKYVFSIDCMCDDKDGISIKSVGFKMKGKSGIVSTLHSLVCPTSVKKITIKNSKGDTYYDLEIREFDVKNDIAILGKKKIPSPKPFIETNETGLSFHEQGDYDKSECGIYSYMYQADKFHKYPMPLVESDKEEVTVLELKKIYNSVHGHMDSTQFTKFDKTPFSNLSPLLEHIGTSVHGLSGSPLYIIDDSCNIKIVGILHSGVRSPEIVSGGLTWFIQPKYLDFDPYEKKTHLSSWGYQVVKRLTTFSKLQIIKKDWEYSIFDNEEKRIDSLKNYDLFKFYYFYKRKAQIAIDNIGTIPTHQWKEISQTAKKRMTKDPNDPLLRLISLYDYIFFEKGLRQSVIADSSLIDSLYFSFQPTGQRNSFDKRNRKFVEKNSNRLLNEISDYRATYTNSMELLEMALDSSNSLTKRLYLARSVLALIAPVKSNLEQRLERIGASVDSYKEVEKRKRVNIYELNNLYEGILSRATQIHDSIDCIAEQDVSATIAYIDSVMSLKDYSKVRFIIDSVLTKKENAHITNRLPRHLIVGLKNNIESFETKQKTLNQWQEEVSKVYYQILSRQTYEALSFPQLECELKLDGDKIRVYFFQGSGGIGSRLGMIYPVSSQLDFPIGVSTISSDESGASISAKFISDFLLELTKLFDKEGHVQEINDQLENDLIKVVVVGMSDGYSYRGNYSEKDEYGKSVSRKKLKTESSTLHVRTNIIDTISCEEVALSKVFQKDKVRENVSLRNWRCESWKECGKDKSYKNNQSFKSYKNNIRLAYHRANNYSAQLEMFLGAIDPRNINYELWACNVSQKDGKCRRTEIGIEINLPDYLLKTPEESAYKAIERNELILREFEKYLFVKRNCFFTLKQAL